MESFFDFIFGNIFIVVIIIAAIINFLNKGKQAEREEQREQQPATPTANKEQTRERRTAPTRVERPVQQAKQTIETVRENVTKTFEEQRQAQYDRLRSQYGRASMNDYDEKGNSQSSLAHTDKLQPVEEKVVTVNVKLEDKLTAKGLVESVIMAEVLGPPRAHNPYQNIVVKRKQYKK